MPRQVTIEVYHKTMWSLIQRERNRKEEGPSIAVTLAYFFFNFQFSCILANRAKCTLHAQSQGTVYNKNIQTNKTSTVHKHISLTSNNIESLTRSDSSVLFMVFKQEISNMQRFVEKAKFVVFTQCVKTVIAFCYFYHQIYPKCSKGFAHQDKMLLVFY